MLKKLIKIGEAANYLGVSRLYLRNLEKKGLIKPIRTAGGHRRYFTKDLDALIGMERVVHPLSEVQVVYSVTGWLEDRGFKVQTRSGAWGEDITAERNGEKWIVECKGSTGTPILYADNAVGEILRRIEKYGSNCKYFIAGPPKIIEKLPTLLFDLGVGVIGVTREGVEFFNKRDLALSRASTDQAGRGAGRLRLIIRLSESEEKYLFSLSNKLGLTESETVRFLIHQSLLLAVFNPQELSELRDIVLSYLPDSEKSSEEAH